MRLFVVVSLFYCLSISNVFVHAADLYTVDGRLAKEKLIRIDQDQFAFQTEMQKRMVSAAEIIRLELGNRTRRQPQQGLVLLANDDRIYGQLLRSEDELILVNPVSYPELGELKIPMETIQAAFFQWPTTLQGRAQLIQKVSQQRKKTDLFYLQNGDSLEGEFLGFDTRTFRFESRAGETSVPRKGIRFFQFNPELINFPQPDRLHYRIVLTDGTRLTVSTLTLNKNVVSAKTLFGAKIQLELNRLISIVPIGGRAVSLSGLKPADYQFTPYFSQKWAWYPNRNVLRGPLIVGGKEFVSGLGTHSAAQLHYQLEGKYTAFQTEVGIDDSTQAAGDVEVSILVDQRVVFQQAIRGSEKQAIVVPRIDLSDAKELVLKVDFGKNADIQDHVNWCRPVLIRQK